MITSIARRTSCEVLAEHAVNVRIATLALEKKDRAVRFLVLRMTAFLGDVEREDIEGMDPVILASCQVLIDDFGPLIIREMHAAAMRVVMDFRHKNL
jgi:hypothetical protein